VHCYGGAINKASIIGQAGNIFPAFGIGLLMKSNASIANRQFKFESLTGSMQGLVKITVSLPLI
jgi:hypothetical protein